MRTIGNIIWLCLGGLAIAIVFAVAGIVFYLTIVGIPLGRQAFKMAKLTLAPFGKEIVYGGGAPSFIANVVWLLFVGLWTALGFVVAGFMWCVSIVGIPFGLQLFKMAKLSLCPFGAEVFSV